MRSGRWTDEELEALCKRYPDERSKDIAKDLGRNVASVYSKANALGVQKSAAFKSSAASGRLQKGDAARPGAWTADELKVLCRRYPDERAEDIANDLGRSLVSVYSKARMLGLEKSEAFQTGEASGRIRKGTNVGAAFRFKKGEGSKRKGKRFPARGRSVETQFKSGHKPHNWLPVGSERVNNGYLQRKMTDTGYPPRDWKFVHRLVWEEHNGPVPKGHVVVFRNGNRQDVRIDNLELVSRAELQGRNSVHNLPEPIREVIALRGQIVRQINRRTERGKEQD